MSGETSEATGKPYGVRHLMREHHRFSPHRRPQGGPVLLDGMITTQRPNARWGTDGIRTETIDQGWVLVFSAVDHCDAGCVDIHAVKFGGIAPSFAFVAEPQTNGVAEHFNRTLKEQALHGRLFRNVEEVRVAVTEFRERYHRHRRLEKLGFMSPLEARQAYAMQKTA